ncbi:hypothetical protein bthur0010_26560 [Bacillus thuringiensis serovar pondicheriensis BGSC 4BA1]|nr:hypothetical protein bthur0010_26560 [Bacillus thuringiensis serovar pondicheriensis BGSC 4BA1]
MQDHYLPKLIQAISFVSEEDLWKQGDSVNSIGGIILHICEHIQRNTSRYKNPNIVFEKGIEEYFPVKRQRTELLLHYSTLKKYLMNGEKHIYKHVEKKDILTFIVYYI